MVMDYQGVIASRKEEENKFCVNKKQGTKGEYTNVVPPANENP